MGRKKSRRNKQKRNPDSDTPPIVEELEGAGLEVLDAIEGVVEFMNTKECIFKAVFESADWYQTLFSSPSVPLSHSSSQFCADKEAIKTATLLKDRLQSFELEFRCLSNWLSEQLGECDRQISSLKLRSGLESLPDEILTPILEFAALPRSKEEHGSLAAAALVLSHVCSRFRSLVISSPACWSCMSNRMHPQLITACGVRLWSSNLKSMFDVLIDVRAPASKSNRVGATKHVVTTMINHSTRCSGFQLTYMAERKENVGFAFERGDLNELAFLAHPLGLPFLSELVILYPARLCEFFAADAQASDNIHFYSAWRTPKLRSMVVQNLIPVPFRGAYSLTSLSISLHTLLFYEVTKGFIGLSMANVHSARFLDIKALASFLSSCPALEDFTLRVYGAPIDVPALTLDHIALERIQNVTLVFGSCTSTVIASILSAVHFPNVSTLSHKIESLDGARRWHDGLAHNIIRVLFPDTFTFGNVVRMKLEIEVFSSYHADGLIVVPIAIPFPCLPKLNHLEITTQCSLEPIGEDVPFPPLRTLRLMGCPNVSPAWVAEILRRHEDASPGERLDVIAEPHIMEILHVNNS